jgi:hypothetical protein
VAAAVGAVNTLTGDSGGAISPTSGNINISGTANEITTTGSGSTITLSTPATFVAPGTISATTKYLVPVAGGAATAGVGTLSVGRIDVASTAVTASSLIFLTYQSTSGFQGNLYILSRTPGTGFTIASSAGSADTSDVAWWFVN